MLAPVQRRPGRGAAVIFLPLDGAAASSSRSYVTHAVAPRLSGHGGVCVVARARDSEYDRPLLQDDNDDEREKEREERETRKRGEEKKGRGARQVRSSAEVAVLKFSSFQQRYVFTTTAVPLTVYKWRYDGLRDGTTLPETCDACNGCDNSLIIHLS